MKKTLVRKLKKDGREDKQPPWTLRYGIYEWGYQQKPGRICKPSQPFFPVILGYFLFSLTLSSFQSSLIIGFLLALHSSSPPPSTSPVAPSIRSCSQYFQRRSQEQEQGQGHSHNRSPLPTTSASPDGGHGRGRQHTRKRIMKRRTVPVDLPNSTTLLLIHLLLQVISRGPILVFGNLKAKVHTHTSNYCLMMIR